MCSRSGWRRLTASSISCSIRSRSTSSITGRPRGGPLRGDAGRDPGAIDAPGARAARHPRRCARRAGRIQRACARPVRQRPPSRPPGRRSARAAILEPLAELEASAAPRVEAEPALVAAVVDQVASGRIERRLAGRGIVDGSGKTRPRRGPVSPAGDGPALGGGARGGGRTCCVSATLRGARRVGPDRAAAPRARAGRPRCAGAPHGAALPPPRDASGTKIVHAVGRPEPDAGDDRRSGSRMSSTRSRPSGRPRPARLETAAAPATSSTTTSLPAAVLDGGARHEAERASRRGARGGRKRRHRRLAINRRGSPSSGLALMSLLTRVCVHAAERGSQKACARRAKRAQLQAEESAARDAGRERPAKGRRALEIRKSQGDPRESREGTGEPGADAALGPRRKQRGDSGGGRTRLVPTPTTTGERPEAECERRGRTPTRAPRRPSAGDAARRNVAKGCGRRTMRSNERRLYQRKQKAERAVVRRAERHQRVRPTLPANEAVRATRLSRDQPLGDTDPEQSVPAGVWTAAALAPTHC